MISSLPMVGMAMMDFFQESIETHDRSHLDKPRGQDVFVGRIAERDQLKAFAELAVSGQSSVVLVEGAAGIGKTALLRRCLPGPRPFRVLRADCDPDETDLAFGLISQLLWRASRGITAAGGQAPAALVPGKQAALPASLPVARAGSQLLEIVYAAQAAAPLVIVIDNMHWADHASAGALGFMLRRLDCARVLTLISARTREGAPLDWAGDGAAGGEYWRRLVDGRQFGRRIRLQGLSTAEVAELATAFGHRMMPLATAERLRSHTGGNPGSLRGLLADPAAGSPARAQRSLPVPDGVAAQVASLLATLAPASRSLLDAIAVLDAKYPLALAARVAALADPVPALEPLLAADIVRWWPEDPATPVRIRLGVQRDAVYRRLTPGRRRSLHLAAAAVVHGDARWAHRVAAVSGTDSALAWELELGAVKALCDGAAERAATMLLWSADLTEDRQAQERRLLAAAAQLIWSHSIGRAEALRPRLAECAASGVRDLILAALRPGGAGDAPVASALAAAIAAMAGPAAGVDLARAAARVALAIVRAGHATDQAGEIAGHVLAIDGLDHETAVMAKCLAAEAAGRDTGDVGMVLRTMASLPVEQAGATTPADRILLWRRAAWRARGGQLAAAADDLAAALRPGRGAAAIDVSANALLAYVQYLLGAWQPAAAAADLASTLALNLGATSAYARAHAIAACIAASSGEFALAEDRLRTSSQWLHTAGPASNAALGAVAAATLAQAKADHAGMLAALAPLPAARGAPLHQWCWWWPLWVEALIGTGQFDEASRALRALAATANVIGCLRPPHAWLSGWLASQRGDPDAALACYADVAGGAPLPAGACPRDDIPLYRARLEHAYGELLLTMHNRRAAVRWLRSARDRYVALGATPFLAACDADLALCGFRAAAVLSAQEGKVACLVAQGLTNREVAQQLFVSTKTVEFHLSNIFTKLGITSRRQLRQDLLAGSLL